MPHHPSLPKAPLPVREIFDPFNSSSTGHQTAPNGLSHSASWRESRSYKLAHQFRDTSGRGGAQHLSDLVRAGSVNWQKDGRNKDGDWEKGAARLIEHGWQDIRGFMSGSRKRPSKEIDDRASGAKKQRRDDGHNAGNIVPCDTGVVSFYAAVRSAKHRNDQIKATTSHDDNDNDGNAATPAPKQLPQIFRGLTMYLNGSTAPEVSDYKLKHTFMQHGGSSSIALGRRSVTHVILGKSCGGGLASGKIHKEVTTTGGKGIKYVTAQWVLDSVEKGIRQPEGRYMPVEMTKRIGGRGQISVETVFSSARTQKRIENHSDG